MHTQIFIMLILKKFKMEKKIRMEKLSATIKYQLEIGSRVKICSKHVRAAPQKA